MINVNVNSEFGVLKKVILCHANPLRITWEEIKTILQPKIFYQVINNKTRYFDYKILRAEQDYFIEILKSNGVEVLLADNIDTLSAQHYTRDIGFAIDNLFVMAKMGTNLRTKEQAGINKFTAQFHNKIAITRGSIEGGDVMLHKKQVLVGLGEATNMDGVNNLKAILQAQNNSREVVPIHFSHRGVIHLDTKFNIVGDGVAMIIPKSFEKSSLRWLENNFDLIEATEKETKEIAINTFSIAPNKIIMKQGSERLGKIIDDKGIKPIFIKYSEVTKLPGSLRCTTCPIERENFYV